MGSKVTRQNLPLEFPQTVSFFKEELESGCDLSNQLLNHIDLSQGHFYTLLPQNINKEFLYEFKTGRIILPKIPERVHIKKLGTFQGEWIDTGETDLVDFLIQKMSQNSRLTAIFEDLIQSPTDPHVNLFHIHGVSCNNHIYYVVDRKNLSKKLLSECFNETHCAWYFFCILTETPLEVPPGKEISPEKLKAASLAAQVVIVGAYDGEGYIIWEKDS